MKTSQIVHKEHIMEMKTPPIFSEPLVDVSNVAAALGISERTVVSEVFLRRIGLTPIRLGPKLMRFRPSDVRAVVARVAGETVVSE